MLARWGLLEPEWPVLAVSLLLTESRREVAWPAEASEPDAAALATLRPMVLKREAKGLLPWLAGGDSGAAQVELGGTGKGGMGLLSYRTR